MQVVEADGGKGSGAITTALSLETGAAINSRTSDQNRLTLSQWNIAWLVLTLTKKGKRFVISGIVIYSYKIKNCLSIEIVRWLYHSLS